MQKAMIFCGLFITSLWPFVVMSFLHVLCSAQVKFEGELEIPWIGQFLTTFYRGLIGWCIKKLDAIKLTPEAIAFIIAFIVNPICIKSCLFNRQLQKRVQSVNYSELDMMSHSSRVLNNTNYQNTWNTQILLKAYFTVISFISIIKCNVLSSQKPSVP